MAAIFHDHGLPSFLGFAPRFSFHDLAQVEALEPIGHKMARIEMELRRSEFGDAWYAHNDDMAQNAWQRHKPWWLAI